MRDRVSPAVATRSPVSIACSFVHLQDDKDLDGNPRVFALQLAVQQITLNLMPTPSHMHADEEQGCFALTLQQARLQAAVEDGVTDIRQVICVST